MVEFVDDTLLILQDDIECVDDSGDVTQKGEEDVDQQVSATPSLESNTERRENNSKNDLADV